MSPTHSFKHQTDHGYLPSLEDQTHFGTGLAQTTIINRMSEIRYY